MQTPRRFDSERFFNGLMLILSGLFRKTVIADNCALLADAAFSGRLGAPNLAVVAIGTYAFAWQIYGDFSGYSDIARGSAQLLGFHFMVNFRQPYLATSLQDFWRRWHISLSTWLRDYLYIPLGGNRDGERRDVPQPDADDAARRPVARGQLDVRRLGRHSRRRAERRAIRPDDRARQSATKSADRVADVCRRPGCRESSIFHLVCLAWVFFRAPSMREAIAFLRGLGTFAWLPEYGIAFRFLALFSVPLFVDRSLQRGARRRVPVRNRA